MGPAGETGAQGGDGRIPFTFRIGVTGHRDLADPETLRLRIREAIVQLLAIVPVAPGAGLALVVVTALAEGADRLVAEEALAAGADRLILEEALAAGADRLAAEQALAARASRLALEEALAAGAGQVIFEEVLAEGADRKVRKKVLVGLDTRLEVALPMDAEEYAKDFQSEASRQEFRFLLARARENDRWQAPDGLEREEAYERAGRYVVDRCDALIAVWDGEESRGRGGTAEIVGYAQQQGVPIAWVHTKGDLPVSYALENSRAEVVQAAARKLRKYNTTRIARWRLRRHERRLRADLMPDMTRTIPIDPLGLSREAVANWVFPYFIRADILALRYQRRFRWLSTAIFVLAASAVVVVAVQAIFWSGDDWGAYIEAPQPPDRAAHPLDEPPVAPARPVDLQSLPGRTAALELFPRAGRDGRPERQVDPAHVSLRFVRGLDRTGANRSGCTPPGTGNRIPARRRVARLPEAALDRQPDLLPEESQPTAGQVR